MRFRRLPLQIMLVSSISTKTALLFLLLSVLPSQTHLGLVILFVTLVTAQLVVLYRVMRSKRKSSPSNLSSSK